MGLRVPGSFARLRGWMEILFFVLAVALLWLLHRHRTHPLTALPGSWTGRGQLLFLLFLWSIVFINSIHVIVRFTPHRIITEWVIALNAIVCTALVLGFAQTGEARGPKQIPFPIRRTVGLGLAGLVLSTALGVGIRRMAFVDRPTSYSGPEQIRFGPNNTNTVK